MITVYLKNDDAKVYNLPNFKREQKLLAAWRVLKEEPKYANKVFVFTETEGKKTKIKLTDMLDVVFEDCVMADAQPVEEK